MTTIITKNGNGKPPSLEVGELAIDKSEPALYTNTGSSIEKIGGGKSGGAGGAGGVCWLKPTAYKNEGAEKFIRANMNGANHSLMCDVDITTNFCQPMDMPKISWPKGDCTLTLTPTAIGGNTIGVIFSGSQPSYANRAQIFVDGRQVYDADRMFEGIDAGKSYPHGLLIGGEIKIIWTLHTEWSAQFRIGSLGVGIS